MPSSFDTQNSATEKLMGKPITGKPVTECGTLDDIFRHCFPAFGGALLRKFYTISSMAIQNNARLVISFAGPITVSDAHRIWLNPLLETGWVAYIAAADAVCYHDAHDLVRRFTERPIREVHMHGNDSAHRNAGIIRVTNTGFAEELLYETDAFLNTILEKPQFQKSMTTTERNYELGVEFGKREKEIEARPGLLSTCARHGIPVFIAAPADGSVFLEHVKMWALGKTSFTQPYRFRYNLEEDVFEACAYHYWGLHSKEISGFCAFLGGGGANKNYILQPEPALSQIFGIPDVRGYDYDVQIVSSPETDGSLTSCPPAEAVTWGKVNQETYEGTTVSVPGDYSMFMPFIIKALIDTLTPKPQLRLYDRRNLLKESLLKIVANII